MRIVPSYNKMTILYSKRMFSALFDGKLRSFHTDAENNVVQSSRIASIKYGNIF